MAEKKGFDLASVLGDVSKLNTEAEQIVLIPADRIDPDPANFYSLEGLEDLAANIELIGLQQPLRVRPAGDRYIIVSGHRRRAAILLIRDGGSEMFAAGVPCIVEYGEASPAMRELRLIYANASSRQMSAADLSKQAERVTELLYQLKEQGVEFPGRMREHVAQACKVSTSKLARLHAIRTNLVEPLLVYFDSGELVEDPAYHLSRLPEDIQLAISDKLADGKKRKMPTGSTVEAVVQNLDRLLEPFSCRAHAGGPPCHNLTGKIVRSVFYPYYWGICSGKECCIDCYRAKDGCPGACREAKDRVKLEAAVEKEKEAARKTDAEIAQNQLKRYIRERAQVLLPYCEAAGLADDQKISGDYRSATVAKLRKWAAGDMEQEHFYGDECVRPGLAKDAAGMAERLGCSLELALGLPEKKAAPAASALEWQTGKPSVAGCYAVRLKVSETAPGELHNFARWDGFQWKAVRSGKVIDDLVAVAWFPLPEV